MNWVQKKKKKKPTKNTKKKPKTLKAKERTMRMTTFLLEMSYRKDLIIMDNQIHLQTLYQK